MRCSKSEARGFSRRLVGVHSALARVVCVQCKPLHALDQRSAVSRALTRPAVPPPPPPRAALRGSQTVVRPLSRVPVLWSVGFAGNRHHSSHKRTKEQKDTLYDRSPCSCRHLYTTYTCARTYSWLVSSWTVHGRCTAVQYLTPIYAYYTAVVCSEFAAGTYAALAGSWVE